MGADGPLLERMRNAGTRSVIVTSIEGRLIGVAVTDDLEPALGQADHHT